VATTYSLPGPTPVLIDLNLNGLSSADRALMRSTGFSTTPAVTKASYKYNAGLSADRIVAEARRGYDSKLNQSSGSWRLFGNLRISVSETGLVTNVPLEAGLFWNYGGKELPSTAELNKLLQMAIMTLMYNLTGANGTPTDVYVSAFDGGVISAYPF
jgi:hypothetical protein